MSKVRDVSKVLTIDWLGTLFAPEQVNVELTTHLRELSRAEYEELPPTAAVQHKVLCPCPRIRITMRMAYPLPIRMVAHEIKLYAQHATVELRAEHVDVHYEGKGATRLVVTRADERGGR